MFKYLILSVCIIFFILVKNLPPTFLAVISILFYLFIANSAVFIFSNKRNKNNYLPYLLLVLLLFVVIIQLLNAWLFMSETIVLALVFYLTLIGSIFLIVQRLRNKLEKKDFLAKLIFCLITLIVLATFSFLSWLKSTEVPQNTDIDNYMIIHFNE